MTFVLTRALEYVNLDHVARAKPVRDGVSLEGADGAYLGVVSRDDFEASSSILISAAPGERAFRISVWTSDDGGRPTDEDVFVEQMQIVAWRVDGQFVQPVLPESEASNTITFVVLPDGQLLDPDNQNFSSLDAARACILRQHQAAWDDKPKRGEPPA